MRIIIDADGCPVTDIAVRLAVKNGLHCTIICDTAITQDYGLAAMCLSKKAIVLNQDGKIYTDDNIFGLLEFRAVSAKIRRGGGRTKNIPKRTSKQNKDFERVLDELIKQNTKNQE